MFKKLLLSASFLLASHVAFSQGVAINEDNSSAATSAILDIKSTTKGLLAPRMTETEKNAITSPATGLLIYQTNATAGFYYYNGSAWTFINAAGQNGLNSLSRTTVEAAGGNCATGGIKVEYGLDINSNGTLDTGEENALLTKFVCNGATGANGTNGLNSLARTTAESAGGNCANGGIKVEYGLDSNNNGTLDAGEINAIFTRYVCNGATGATGSTGATGATGQGVPTGGTTGQVLTKINGTDYNTQWTTASGGGGTPTLQLRVAQTGGITLNTTTVNLVQWGTPSTNVGSQFNTGTESFTVQTAGLYSINALFVSGSIATNYNLFISVNGTNVSHGIAQTISGIDIRGNVQLVTFLNAGDVVLISSRKNNTTSTTTQVDGYFEIIKLN